MQKFVPQRYNKVQGSYCGLQHKVGCSKNEYGKQAAWEQSRVYGCALQMRTGRPRLLELSVRCAHEKHFISITSDFQWNHFNFFVINLHWHMSWLAPSRTERSDVNFGCAKLQMNSNYQTIVILTVACDYRRGFRLIKLTCTNSRTCLQPSETSAFLWARNFVQTINKQITHYKHILTHNPDSTHASGRHLFYVSIYVCNTSPRRLLSDVI